MKKIAVVLLVLVGVVAAIVLAVFLLTGGIVDSVDGFFTAVAAGDHEAARSHLATAFLAEMSEEELAEFFAGIGQSGYGGASWHTRNIANDEGLLEGTLETADGGKIPVSIDLVKESGEWRILAIRQAATGLVSDQAGLEIPDLATLERLVDEAVQELAHAINDDDFGAFHASIARLWQAQTTAAELRAAFAPFVDQQIDLTVLSGMQPVLSEEPRLDDDGVLYLVGYYPSQPAVTHFDLKYIYEHPVWKLLGAGVEVR